MNPRWTEKAFPQRYLMLNIPENVVLEIVKDKVPLRELKRKLLEKGYDYISHNQILKYLKRLNSVKLVKVKREWYVERVKKEEEKKENGQS